MRLHIFCTAFLLPLLSSVVLASTPEIEKKWADSISNTSGETISLEAGQDKFIGLLIDQTSAKPRGGIILLHDRGLHPDWPAVIKPLRTGLPRFGWTTIAIQMPLLGNDSTLENYGPLLDEVPDRINSAIATLEARGIGTIVLVGHGFGATMAVSFLAVDSSKVSGFIGIAMGQEKNAATEKEPRLYPPNSLEKIKIPILDIYGNMDRPEVTNTNKARAAAARKAASATTAESSPSGTISYRQIKISGANHHFSGLSKVLVKRVRGWLERHIIAN